MANAEQFGRQLQDFVRTTIPTASLRQQRAAALTFGVECARRTPRLTGRHSASWRSSYSKSGDLALVPRDTPPKVEIANFYPYTSLGELKRGLQGAKPFGVITTSNNAEAIVFLDRGSSDQAPAGFTAQARAVAIQAANAESF